MKLKENVILIKTLLVENIPEICFQKDYDQKNFYLYLIKSFVFELYIFLQYLQIKMNAILSAEFHTFEQLQMIE